MSQPFRLTSPEPLEADIHEMLAKVLRLVIQPPACWTTFPAGNIKLAPADAAKLSRLGLQRGWPDILVIHDAQVFGLELKRHGRGLSRSRIVRTRRGGPRILEGQTDTFPRLEAAGMKIAVVDDVDRALDQLARWGIPLRGHLGKRPFAEASQLTGR